MCSTNPYHPCCLVRSDNNIDRIFPIGEFVQPSLLENWVSVFFEYFGQNPIAFVLLQNFVLFLVVGTLALAWGYLGQLLGIIPTLEFARSRSNEGDSLELVESSSAKVNFSIHHSDDWLRKIEERITSDKIFSGTDQFLCCFVPNDSALLKDDESQKDGILQCVPKKKSEKIDSSFCTSKLIYSISLKHKSVEKNV